MYVEIIAYKSGLNKVQTEVILMGSFCLPTVYCPSCMYSYILKSNTISKHDLVIFCLNYLNSK